MAINYELLIAAPMLQDYLVDNVTAQAMSNGVISLYQDNSRTTYKNWYYQSGTPGAYTYIPLPNPLTLSAIGTICDANGNDTIPFYYPYSENDNQTFEPYYIVVVDSNGQQQFTRANFPYVPIPAIGEPIATLRNYITNNVFWRNIGTLNATTLTTNPLSGLLSAKLAPSQHDGFSMPDLQFIKNVNGATDTITFTKFALNNDPLVGDITPEYYINHNCSALQAGETLKCYQMPISLHLKTLENVDATVTLQAQNNGGTNNTITISIYPFYGTGATSPAPVVEQTITLNDGWQKYAVSFVMPNIPNTATLGAGGDDAYYLQIGVPLSQICNFNFTKPSIYLSNEVPTNDFDTYDEIDAVINSPRTGDIRTSLNDFYPFGWVPLNNGTIGDAASNATGRANIDTWPLFNLIWAKFNAFSNGTANVLAPMVNSSGSAVAYGASAIADWNANNSIALTQTMGKVILGTVPVSAMTNVFSTGITSFSSGGGNLQANLANTVGYFSGMPIYFTNTGGSLPTGLSPNTIYYVGVVGGAAIFISTSFANAIAGTYIAFTNAGSGTSAVVGAYNNTQEGEYAHVQLLTELAAHTHPPLSPMTAFAGLAGTAPTFNFSTGSNDGQALTTGSRGSSAPFNITQPGVFVNMFMKL